VCTTDGTYVVVAGDRPEPAFFRALACGLKCTGASRCILLKSSNGGPSSQTAGVGQVDVVEILHVRCSHRCSFAS